MVTPSWQRDCCYLWTEPGFIFLVKKVHSPKQFLHKWTCIDIYSGDRRAVALTFIFLTVFSRAVGRLCVVSAVLPLSPCWRFGPTTSLLLLNILLRGRGCNTHTHMSKWLYVFLHHTHWHTHAQTYSMWCCSSVATRCAAGWRRSVE